MATQAGRRPMGRAAIAVALVVICVLVAAAVGTAVLGLGPWSTPVAGSAGPVPAFVDDTAGSGVAFTYDGGFAYAVGGGVAVLDCDDDGRPDVYLAGGAGPAALFRNTGEVGGRLTFERVASAATDLDAVNGAYPLDVDGDGSADLMTLRNGENVVLRGRGDCRFERANEAWGLEGGNERTNAFSATWEAGNAWPTVAFGNYVDPDSEDPTTWCQPNEVIRPVTTSSTGGGAFGPVTNLKPSWCALSMLFSDWDGSGRRDLRVSNDAHYYLKDMGSEQLWRMEPNAAPRLYTTQDGWASLQLQGMGVGSYDLTGDGLPEVYLTSQAANRLQSLESDAGRPAYRDIGLELGTNVPHPFTGNDMDLPSTAWHPEFADVNNDGFVDLFVSKGSITGQADYAVEDPSNLLLGQPIGPFVEGALDAGILTFDRGRGAALVDFNLDGRLDLIESFYGTPARVWRNLPPSDAEASNAHWLALGLEQPGPNVDSVGAVVEVRAGGVTWRRELTVGGGHAGGQLGWVHFGLGSASGAEVRVRWPDGEVGPWQLAGADGFVIVERGAAQVVRWVPPAS